MAYMPPFTRILLVFLSSKKIRKLPLIITTRKALPERIWDTFHITHTLEEEKLVKISYTPLDFTNRVTVSQFLWPSATLMAIMEENDKIICDKI